MSYYPQYAPPPAVHGYYQRPRQPSSVPSNQVSPGGGGGGAVHPPAFVPLQVDHDHIPGACGVNYYCIVFVLYLYWVAVAHGVH